MSDLPADPASADPASADPTPTDPIPDAVTERVPADAPQPRPEPVAVAPTAGSPGPGRLALVGVAALAVVLAFAGGIAVGRATAPGADTATPPPAAGSPGTSPAATPEATAGGTPTTVPTGLAALPAEGSRLGRADAKVVVDYWADYQCPFCAKFAQEVLPLLASRIADGTIAVVHRDFAFLDARSAGQESLDAAIAARCAGRQDAYWPMHDAVYAAQAGENQGAFSRDKLAALAAGIGLDEAAFATCMDSREALVEVLEDTSAAARSGLTSTPTVDVNGQRFPGVADPAELLAAIDAAAAGASPVPLPTAAPLGDPWTDIGTDGSAAGDPGAPVTVELWMDYQLPSATIVSDLEPELRSRIADGSIRLVRRDLATLGDESVLAAATVRCVARQGGPAWFTHDVLANSGRGAGQDVYTVTRILRFASQLGLDIADLSDCLDDPATESEITLETAVGTNAGLSGAPSVIVRRGETEVARFSGELDVARILAAIDGAR